MAGEGFSERAGAEIDRLGGDRDGERREQSADGSEPRPAPQENAGDRRGGQRRKRGCDERQVIVGPVAEGSRQLHQPGNDAGQYPGPHAELEFPGDEATAKDEAVGRFGGLKDLVRPHRGGLDEDRLKAQQNCQRNQRRKADPGADLR